MQTIQDIITCLRERSKYKTHYEGCERNHIDCAAIMALTMFKKIAETADDAAFETNQVKQGKKLNDLRKQLNDANAKWLSTFLNETPSNKTSG